MRMLLFCAALLFPSLAMAQQVNRTTYSAGTATLGGCTGPTSTLSYTVGACLPLADTSIWVNDCWSNGVLSLTSYNSNNCAPATATSMTIAGANIVGTSLNQSYCNVGGSPSTYTTVTCSAATPPPAQTIRVFIYPTVNPFNNQNCSGTPLNAAGQDVPAGVCTQITGTGTDPKTNPALYVMGNCANGLVTSVIYNTSNCAVTFDSTGALVTNVAASGPWGQINATSAAGKAINAPGASCSLPNPQAYFAYTCLTPTTAPGTTTAPPTSTPTPTTSPPTKSAATSVTAGAATFLALVIAAVANLL